MMSYSRVSSKDACMACRHAHWYQLAPLHELLCCPDWRLHVAVVYVVMALLQIPYSDMTPLQAAVGVVQKGLRPVIPSNCLPQLAHLMMSCWDASPMHRWALCWVSWRRGC
jgi:hypothetical protein